MKIGLIGNMNNNNFAIMRYFRDLGADAHLLLWKGEAQGTKSHFSPESDTWQFDRWYRFVHRIDIENWYTSVVGDPQRLVIQYRLLCYLKYGLKAILNRRPRRILPTSKNDILRAFGRYDVLVGSGLSPAILDRANLRLDCFYPYSSGIEFVGAPEWLIKGKNQKSYLTVMVRTIVQKQLVALRKARYIFNADLGLTKQVLERSGIEATCLAIPMVYNRDPLPCLGEIGTALRKILSTMEECDLSIFHHARLEWTNSKRMSSEDWVHDNKNNDWLFRAFASLLQRYSKRRLKLFVVEYGEDVDATRQLCADLGITQNVFWLPKMTRKEIMVILKHCHVGVGEFIKTPGCIWGGTGWEVLASGRPLLQTFNFKQGEFDQHYGYPPPPMLSVQSEGDIYDHLEDMLTHPQKAHSIGQGAVDWFNRYNGINLAKKCLDMLISPLAVRS